MMAWNRGSVAAALVCGTLLVVAAASMLGACGGAAPAGFMSADGPDSSIVDSSGGAGVDSASQGGVLVAPEAGLADTSAPPSAPGPCPAGLTCNVACAGGAGTTITGKVYDPAGNNPLFDVAVYVPAKPLTPLPKGVPTGKDACSCGALFPSGAVTSTTTAVDGSFTLTNVPVGSAVPLVLQIGKWRRQIDVPVKGCQDNPLPDKSLAFLGTIPAGDTLDSIPDIAVSTGSADTLECLLLRIGLPTTEYVAGAAAGGHVHVFSGGSPQTSTPPAGATGAGAAENPPMTGAPASWTNLWDKVDDLMPYDILLLSCEGGETYNSNPPVLEAYLNAGGRAFASHYHYAWFAGSVEGDNTVPPPPSDWGLNLAAWDQGAGSPAKGYAQIVQTLNGSSKPFPKGVALAQWLGDVNALGVEGAPAGEIPIFEERGNAGVTNKAQAWLVDGPTSDYLSFDTPVNAPPLPDGGPPSYCGRAVYAGVHVDGDTNAASSADKNPPPNGCAGGPLSPQEKALEFMLFDLSDCVLPDTVAPPVDAGLPPPPK